MAKPRVTGNVHELPFEKLSARDFERLCLWLVRREGYPTAEHHGAAGRDRGRDLVAPQGEGLVAFQCKREKHFGPAKAEDAVRKILDKGQGGACPTVFAGRTLAGMVGQAPPYVRAGSSTAVASW